MANSLVSPPELSPMVPESATPQQCIAMWVDLMNACEQFLLAGLRREIGPDGDLRFVSVQFMSLAASLAGKIPAPLPAIPDNPDAVADDGSDTDPDEDLLKAPEESIEGQD